MSTTNGLEELMPRGIKVTNATKAAAKKAPAKKATPAKKAAVVKKAAAPSTNGRTPMSKSHKASLEVGRTQGRTVRRYLEALTAAKPKRGRQRTPEAIEKRLTAIQAAIPGADPMLKLSLIQERMDLEAELATKDQAVDLSELEAGFIEVGADYATRKGYSYAAFQELGIPPEVLKRAGITRS